MKAAGTIEDGKITVLLDIAAKLNGASQRYRWLTQVLNWLVLKVARLRLQLLRLIANLWQNNLLSMKKRVLLYLRWMKSYCCWFISLSSCYHYFWGCSCYTGKWRSKRLFKWKQGSLHCAFWGLFSNEDIYSFCCRYSESERIRLMNGLRIWAKVMKLRNIQ